MEFLVSFLPDKQTLCLKWNVLSCITNMIEPINKAADNFVSSSLIKSLCWILIVYNPQIVRQIYLLNQK